MVSLSHQPLARAPAVLDPLRNPEQVFASPALRVLVANNNMEAADDLARLLRAEGYRVSVCYDSHAALQMVPACRPDAALLGLGLAGSEVVRRLREVPSRRPLLVALTTPAGEGRCRAFAAGFDACVATPAGLTELRALLAARAVPAPVRAA
jgi:CheY-like chemotaxis protein